MIGIYRIISPSGKIYIGQSINLERREFEYSKVYKCKGQPRLHASLVKYGFSTHLFEVIEECTAEQLNIRERHWQEFYNVLSERGLNCRLTHTLDKSGVHSIESTNKQIVSRKLFELTPEGREVRATMIANIKAFYKTPEGRACLKNRASKIDYVASNLKRLASRDEVARAEKNKKSIIQHAKDETFIKEWTSGKEAGNTLGIHPANITACLKGRYKHSGGFIWKYKEI
jgi:group I intron endonuclease